MEGGNGKPVKPTAIPLEATDGELSNTNQELTMKPASVTITLTPDDITQTKEFESRLKQALEQSRLLQVQQMNQIKNLENELSQADKDEGLGIIDAVSEKPKPKKAKKLKGILKKPKV